MKADFHFRGQGFKFRSTGNPFPENNIFRQIQTLHFPEIDFRNSFEVDSNAPLNAYGLLREMPSTNASDS